MRLLQSGTGTVDTRSETTVADAGVAWPLVTGTRLAVEANATDNALNGHPLAAARLGVSVTQALLQGAGVTVNRVGLRQAQIATALSVYEFRGQVEAFVAEIERMAYDHALATRREAIVRESLRLADQHLAEVGERIRIGKLAQVERCAAEAEVARRREALINAVGTREAVRLRLVRVLHLPATHGWDCGVDLAMPFEPAAVVSADPVVEHLTAARRWRPELNQARLARQREELEIVRTRNGLLPKLDVFAALGSTGYAEALRGTPEGELDRGSDWQIGVRLEQPLPDRQARARHTRAVMAREQGGLAMDNLCRLVELDVQTACVDLARCRSQVEASAATRRLEAELLRAETAKFRVGKSTSLLVAQAQRDLLESEVTGAEALAGCFKALTALYRLDGTLLLRRGIAAPGAETVPDAVDGYRNR